MDPKRTGSKSRGRAMKGIPSHWVCFTTRSRRPEARVAEPRDSGPSAVFSVFSVRVLSPCLPTAPAQSPPCSPWLRGELSYHPRLQLAFSRFRVQNRRTTSTMGIHMSTQKLDTLKNLLKDILGTRRSFISIEEVIRTVSKHYGLKPADLKSPKRAKPIEERSLDLRMQDLFWRIFSHNTCWGPVSTGLSKERRSSRY